MRDPEPDLVDTTLEAVIGRWKCFESDGIHGWSPSFPTIEQSAAGVSVERIFPIGTPTGDVWARSGPRLATCSLGRGRVHLVLNDEPDGELGFQVAADGTLRHYLARVPSGWRWFQRTRETPPDSVSIEQFRTARRKTSVMM